MKECEYCGKELGRGQTRFCSRTCVNKYRWDTGFYAQIRGTKPCRMCGKEFEFKRSSKLYCSDVCKERARWQKKKEREGPKHTPGQSVWKATRDRKFKEQDGKCWVCGGPIKGKFHGHHLLGGDDRSNYSEDVVALHPACHNQLHKVTLCTDGERWWVSGKIFTMLEGVKDMKRIEIRTG